MSEVVYYIGGHADDPLLFRGGVRWADMHLENVKSVHIITTAGDAGRTDGWWQAREQGLVDACAASMSPRPITKGKVTINGFRIQRYTTSEWACYFMRLPDGNLDNNGFASTGNKTLGKLQAGTITALPAVDGSATYPNWLSFVNTLKAVITTEQQGTTVANPWVNASDYDRTVNPGDHPDHYATADALRSFLAPTFGRAWWASYDTADREPNLDTLWLAAKRFAFYAYSWSVYAAVGQAPDDGEWDRWGDKEYARIEPPG